MSSRLQPNCHPLLIGSLPLDDHQSAARLIMDYSPAMPLWVQLPVFAQEKMVSQFLPGLPAVAGRDGHVFIDTAAVTFDAELLSFYEDYMTVIETPDRLDDSRFALTADTRKGVDALLDTLRGLDAAPMAVKGQVTGPITFCTGVKVAAAALIGDST